MMQPPKPATPDSVSDQELQKFANVTDSAQSIQKEVQSQVQTLVEEEGMEFARFQKLMQSQRNPQSSVQPSAEEQKKIKAIQPQLMKINRSAQQQFVQLIQDEGLTPQRFQQIMQGVRQHQELQQRLQSVQSDS
ncbi:DUF4168 domain-containing protein [Aliifodinibius sp. S!AR15-10]|uniref:DUF4168 domain-containing protein n=1 Tax=Aliifodinibius sp. S!AR15-10 TaxID=2950437 RepID=UPI00285BD0E2|nr:DUF4168 domain-containing protein [Aliifodinibius sp. S!AR15-10]MDR8393051.1 DUF4168 domain-containing protein [Aliifodinibius sp. S!AR15-10]